ncbi:hypothetical protein GCM10009827_010840 [Dactylosporangium maewongense]|uniref:Ricin B lectin domain-containing protein n=2 Tax=Micromonosporaceae TaxID=28056 RepID=A0ABP4KDB6_9ACTN
MLPVVAVVTLLAATPAPASAQAAAGRTPAQSQADSGPAPEGRIYNRNAAKCIGIANGLAGIYTCTTNNDQTWHSPAGSCHPTYPTYCMYVNGDGRCLAVNGGNIYNGSRILGFPCTGSLDQYWARALDPNQNSVEHNLMNLKGGLEGCACVLAVQSISTYNGAPVVLWASNGSADQHWTLF